MRDDRMETKRLSCEEVDERIEDAADGALEGEELRLFEVHLAECPTCRAQLEAARAVREELETHFSRSPVPAEELERTAVAAAVRAFNAIEEKRRGAAPSRRRAKASWTRRLVLLGGWVGAILVGIRAAVVAQSMSASTPAGLAESVDTNPVLVFGARLFETTPLYFVAGLALLALALGYSLRTAFQRD